MLDSVIIPFTKFAVLDQINYGPFPNSYSCESDEYGNVCICPIISDCNEKKIDLYNGLVEVRDISHKNILRHYGVTQYNGSICIVVERFDNDCRNLSFSKSNKSEDWQKRLDIVESIINGYKILHSKGVLSTYMSLENVVRKENGEYALFGYGFCDLFDSLRKEMERIILDPRFIAPEMVENQNLCNREIDMYRIGIFMYVLLNNDISGCETGMRYLIGLARGVRPEIPQLSLDSYTQMIRLCWNQNPSQRPSCETLLTMLSKCYLEVNNIN